jgi:hypothetical protein
LMDLVAAPQALRQNQCGRIFVRFSARSQGQGVPICAEQNWP